jgi:hypothetical protein
MFTDVLKATLRSLDVWEENVEWVTRDENSRVSTPAAKRAPRRDTARRSGLEPFRWG